MRHLVVVAALLAGCYNPTLQDGQFTCANGGSCPAGLSCNACNQCTSSPNATCDLGGGGGGDGGQPSSSPCTNGGQRAMGDFGLATLALCPAAWAAPGMATAPACGRAPTMNGKSAGGTSCAAADNCAAGWHVCRDQADLQAHGLTSTLCKMINNAPALFVTAQLGAPPQSPGPPTCGGTMQHIVFGCGGLGGNADTATCTLVDRVLTDMPNDANDDCATATSGAFSCKVSGGTFEYQIVTKSTPAGGGVMCCTD